MGSKIGDTRPSDGLKTESLTSDRPNVWEQVHRPGIPTTPWYIEMGLYNQDLNQCALTVHLQQKAKQIRCEITH